MNIPEITSAVVNLLVHSPLLMVEMPLLIVGSCFLIVVSLYTAGHGVYVKLYNSQGIAW